MADAIAKYATTLAPLSTVILARFTVQALIMVPWSFSDILQIKWTRQLAVWILIRAVFQLAAGGFMVASLAVLPLADTIAIALVLPFLILTFGRLILGEASGWLRLGACIIGFMGALIVIHPSFEHFGLTAFLPLLLAACIAGFFLITRHLTSMIAPVPLHAVSAAISFMLLVIFCLLFAPEAFKWPKQALWALLATGLFMTGARLAMTVALAHAPASTLAPLKYLDVPVAAVLGTVFFDDIPDGNTGFGIGLIFASGLFILLRERQASSSASQ